MTDTPGSAEAAGDDSNSETSSADDTAQERFAAIMRFPRNAALISGALVLVAIAIQVLVLDEFSLPLLGVAVLAALVCVLAVWNVVNFSSTAVARLEALSPQVGGRFWLWKAGAGRYEGGPFAFGVDHQRFGMLNFVVHGMMAWLSSLRGADSPGVVAPCAAR